MINHAMQPLFRLVVRNCGHLLGGQFCSVL